ncbi:membrane protein [Sphaerisporangium krabiense]|uniref:DME family drug/metabolite transporter n=1 Tax=Sphaerisporangium krabiense TaxID=763782 RepID=A0A7W8Z611_9ACTN|nr:DMT family transporter [Sphaerisporangium krabiense]MBB5628124.1 DME family drug/metabolite transporter [Sphaerisporangium krabiense]GII62291.1 membrane protein [Sphaerisporangium krabiense]
MTHVSVSRGLLYVTVAAVIWGTGGPAAAVLYQVSGLGPVAVSFWRFVFGAAVMFAAARVARVAAARPRWTTVGLAGCGLAVSQAAYFGAVAEIGVAMATVITLGASPALVALGARLWLGERPGRGAAGGMVLAPAGLLLMAGDLAAVSPAGLALSLLSAVAYAAVTLLPRAARAAGGDSWGTAMWGFAAGGLLLAPIAAAEGLLPGGGEVTTLALLAYLGVMPTAVAYGLFFTGLSAVRATTASVVALLEPAAATAIGVLLLGERLTPAAAAGAAVLLGSVAFLALGESRRAG